MGMKVSINHDSACTQLLSTCNSVDGALAPVFIGYGIVAWITMLHLRFFSHVAGVLDSAKTETRTSSGYTVRFSLRYYHGWL